MSASVTQAPVRPDWLATHDEPVIDPGQLIIDTHHHLYERTGIRYLFHDYLEDVATGHDVRASIYVQARAMLRSDGPVDAQPVGEVEFANGVAAMSASGLYGPSRLCAGIVGFADLMVGDAVQPVLEKEIAAAGGLTVHGGRYCGVRQTLCWDEDKSLLNPAYPTTADMIDSAQFRSGFAQLSKLGLNFEAWAFFPQLSDIARLARAYPETPIVLNHCGGGIRIREYEARKDVFDNWRLGIIELAQYDNVQVKLSGLGMHFWGFGLEANSCAPDSELLARTWRPWVDHCLEQFGTDRCMWGSNFPVDKGSYGFKIGLNAFKRLMAGASSDESDAVFWRTARDFYRLHSSDFGNPKPH
ncbi:amidohydrolase [Sphingomonas sp. Root710]|uniref:amidohydrolase family protein n=1 Tax=Sphingomonas sp. Root710 TaxID=1736594 RepID=UPI0006F22612|nr:amidohydrolase family protein [Sphingomonas sp. Root710]KRB84071.1 amidohydrolase [Sphingomonas sp. Root710]